VRGAVAPWLSFTAPTSASSSKRPPSPRTTNHRKPVKTIGLRSSARNARFRRPGRLWSPQAECTQPRTRGTPGLFAFFSRVGRPSRGRPTRSLVCSQFTRIQPGSAGNDYF
jgi:hypothetical protein